VPGPVENFDVMISPVVAGTMSHKRIQKRRKVFFRYIALKDYYFTRVFVLVFLRGVILAGFQRERKLRNGSIGI
jgi:hypothetical protein